MPFRYGNLQYSQKSFYSFVMDYSHSLESDNVQRRKFFDFQNIEAKRKANKRLFLKKWF